METLALLITSNEAIAKSTSADDHFWLRASTFAGRYFCAPICVRRRSSRFSECGSQLGTEICRLKDLANLNISFPWMGIGAALDPLDSLTMDLTCHSQKPAISSLDR